MSVPVERKPKKCKACKKPFNPANSMQIVCCGVPCGIEYAQAQRIKKTKKQEAAERKETTAKLEKLKTRGDHLRETQVAFNTMIRARDAYRGCISCGTNNGKMNAGHYRSVGSCPELRFEEDNVHKQCERCNTFLHGNLLGYRAGLRGRITEERLEWIEGPHPAKHYTTDELKAMKARFRAAARQLQKETT